MRNIFAVLSVVAIATLVASGATQVKQSSEIRVLGYFDATVTDGEHQTGYALELWRRNDTAIGFLIVAQGLIGDAPLGVLENVSLTPDGHLALEATVPGGWITEKEQQVSRYTFNGILGQDTVEGVLQSRTLVSRESVTQRTVRFRRLASMTEVMRDYPSYDEWKVDADRMLKRRGVKR
jgi:hypothetical protein